MNLKEKTIAQVEQELRDACLELVELLNNSDSDDEMIRNARAAMKVANSYYNKKAAMVFYEGLVAEHGKDAVREGIKAYNVTGLIRATITTDRKSGRRGYELKSFEAPIDLNFMMKVVGAEYFPNPQWYAAMLRLSTIMTANKNKELMLKDRDFSALLKEAGAAFEFAEDANFTSNRSAKKAMQCVADMIVFEKDPKKGDLNRWQITQQDLVYMDSLLCDMDEDPEVILMRGSDEIINLFVRVLCRKFRDKALSMVV